MNNIQKSCLILAASFYVCFDLSGMKLKEMLEKKYPRNPVQTKFNFVAPPKKQGIPQQGIKPAPVKVSPQKQSDLQPGQEVPLVQKIQVKQPDPQQKIGVSKDKKLEEQEIQKEKTKKKKLESDDFSTTPTESKQDTDCDLNKDEETISTQKEPTTLGALLTILKTRANHVIALNTGKMKHSWIEVSSTKNPNGEIGLTVAHSYSPDECKNSLEINLFASNLNDKDRSYLLCALCGKLFQIPFDEAKGLLKYVYDSIESKEITTGTDINNLILDNDDADTKFGHIKYVIENKRQEEDSRYANLAFYMILYALLTK